MNILLFPRIVALSGVGNHVTQLAEELTRQGHNVVVMASTNDRHIGEDETSNITFVKLPHITLNPLHIWGGVRRIRSVIEQYDIQLVHCHHRMPAMYMKFYRLIHPVPMVYSLHLANIPADFLHRSMTYPGDKAIGVSTEVCEYMTKELNIPKEKVVKILNGVDQNKLLPLTEVEMEELRVKWNIKEGKTVVSMHARIDPMKNQLLVIDAIHRLNNETRDKVCVLCSGEQVGNYYEEMKRRISDYSHEEEANGDTATTESVFRFTGWADTRDILGMTDLLVLPATNDGFALSVLEAFHMNVLVARTETAGFEDQKYCIPISGEEPDDISNLIARIANNGIGQYNDLVHEAHEYALENFTIKRMTEKTVEVYESVLCQYGNSVKE